MLAQPAMLYGTAWKAANTTALVVQAVREGFRGIDTACQPKHYRQELVGEALQTLSRDHGIPREEIWLQTKFTSLDGQDLSKPIPYDKNAPLATQVQQSFATSLQQLGTSYIDSLVMHSPMRTKQDNLIVWKEFEALVKEGKVHQLGISNIYDPDLLRWAFETFDIKPSVVQNRFCEEHLHYCGPILALCEQYGAKFQSFWTLSANPTLLASPPLRSLASQQSLTPPQALYKLLIQSSRFDEGRIVPLNGTTSLKHMKEDLAVLDLVEEEKQSRGESRAWTKAEKEVEELLWG
ncbi:Aldo/keto reductase [Leucosporidium creatinivorum]|uniref:Aldo/keto reductase n=1 Tax=Leucosporidium creatinivorum TaxID=106004 RepID=A0A1Y2G239_9BASI|nr:Aldo/keto reductase [Leucosporidium creatinivorum]